MNCTVAAEFAMLHVCQVQLTFTTVQLHIHLPPSLQSIVFSDHLQQQILQLEKI